MQRFVLFFLLILSSFQAKANFYGEPFINRMGGTWTQDLIITSPVSGTAKGESTSSGFQYGGRIGYIWTNFNFGVQISAAKGKQLKSKLTTTVAGISTVSNVTDSDFSRTDNGLVLGYKFGPMFRMWFSSLSTHMTGKDADGTETRYKGVTGLFGFGWYVGSYISINLELGGTKYSEENGQQYSFTKTASGVTETINAPKEALFFFGISIPLGVY